MGHVNSELAFNAIAIRDTADHTGTTINNFDFQLKTIVIENSLDQAVTFQCQGSVHSDFSNSFNIGTTWDIEATTNGYQTCDTFFPFMRLMASCAIAPTTGSMNAHFVQYGG